MAEEKKLVGRSQRVAFMNVGDSGSSLDFQRMTGFTNMTNAKNPKEYGRQYVDEDSERSDVVGYAPSIDLTGIPIHRYMKRSVKSMMESYLEMIPT